MYEFRLKISLKFVPTILVNNIPALIQIMAWQQPGDKPLSEPMMVNLLMHVCVTLPQWAKLDSNFLTPSMHVYACMRHAGQRRGPVLRRANVVWIISMNICAFVPINHHGANNCCLRQQAITWANVDPDLCCYMAPLGHNELRDWRLFCCCFFFKEKKKKT